MKKNDDAGMRDWYPGTFDIRITWVDPTLPKPVTRITRTGTLASFIDLGRITLIIGTPRAEG